MTEEFRKAAEIVDRIMVNKAEWLELFTKHDFFHKYRYYLQVIASSGDPEMQKKWSGTVESRVRQLVMKLELVESLQLVHPFIKGFDQQHYVIGEAELNAVSAGEISEAVSKRTAQDIENVEGGKLIYSTTFYIGLRVEPKPAGSVGPRRLDISYPTAEFTKMVKLWESFIPKDMGIVVRHIKSAALPDYVFDKGERQPKQALKRPKGSKTTEKSSESNDDKPAKKRRSSYPPADIQALSSGVPKVDSPLPTLPSRPPDSAASNSSVPGLSVGLDAPDNRAALLGDYALAKSPGVTAP